MNRNLASIILIIISFPLSYPIWAFLFIGFNKQIHIVLEIMKLHRRMRNRR
jgi:hypothetical protein